MRFTVDGTPAYAYSGGKAFDATLPRIVFVHGAQHDHSVWVLQTRYLAHHKFAVAALDLPGHGRSAGTPIDSVSGLADWVVAANEQLGTAPTVIVGHSLGSLIALECTRTRPAWLAGIALVATASPMKVADALLAAADTDESRAFDMINRWSNSAVTHLPGCPGPGFSIVNQNLRLMQRQAPGTLAIDFRACDAYGDGPARAATCAVPVLVVQPGADQMTPPRASQALIDTLRAPRADGTAPPVVTVRRIDGAGHNVMAEKPDALLAVLRDWMPHARR